MSRKRSRKRNWPPELKGPFPMQQLEDQAMETAGDAGNADQLYTQCLRELWEAETKRRVTLVAKFFGKPWPQGEGEWLELIFLICAGFEAPGFQSGLAGASKKMGQLAERPPVCRCHVHYNEKRTKGISRCPILNREPRRVPQQVQRVQRQDQNQNTLRSISSCQEAIRPNRTH